VHNYPPAGLEESESVLIKVYIKLDENATNNCLLTLPLLEDVYYRAKAFKRQIRRGEEHA
jgi:hypothetical protein